MDAAFRRYAEQCPDAVMVTDRDGRIEYVNGVFERMTGYARAELVGHSAAMLKSGTHEADFYRGLWKALMAGDEFPAVFCNRRKNGERYYEEKIIRPLGAPGAAAPCEPPGPRWARAGVHLRRRRRMRARMRRGDFRKQKTRRLR